MGSCPPIPNLTSLNLGPRSLAGLIIHFQFLLAWFGMPGMPIVKPVVFGMPGMPGMKLECPAWLILMFAPASCPENRIIAKHILGSLKLQVSCPAINADYNKKSHVCHNVCHGIYWQNWRQKPGFINKNYNKTRLFMHKIEYFTCNQRSINTFISNRYWHFWVQI